MLIFLYESDNIMIFESDLKKYKYARKNNIIY